MQLLTHSTLYRLGARTYCIRVFPLDSRMLKMHCTCFVIEIFDFVSYSCVRDYHVQGCKTGVLNLLNSGFRCAEELHVSI